MHARAFALVLVSIASTACSGAEGAREKDSDASGKAASASKTVAPKENLANDPLVALADSGRIRGNPAAKVWMIITSDFQCPYCKMWHDQTDLDIRREYIDNGKVRLAFVNFPLENHKHAVPASEYAMCASAQGKFWEMHDQIFAAQERWTPMDNATAVFDELAGKIAGLDLNALRACLASDKMLPIIQADREKGVTGGVRATPSFFIGNQLLEGVQPTANLRRVLDAALANAR